MSGDVITVYKSGNSVSRTSVTFRNFSANEFETYKCSMPLNADTIGTVGIVGFPFSKAQPRGGTELGPRALREGGIVKLIEELGNKVADHGDLSLPLVENDPPIGKMKNSKNVGAANKMLADAVEQSLGRGETCLVLGGDHSMGIGSVAGQARRQPDMVLVWVDAHADINTPLTSNSGNLHGMPLAFLLHEMARYLPSNPAFSWCKPCLYAKDLVYIGLRDVEGCEKLLLEKLGIAAYSMQEVDKYGIASVVERALRDVDPTGSRPIHVSFDVDAIDPTHCPATGTPVKGGLSLRESLYIAEEIAATGRLSVLDITEVNPMLSDASGQTVTVESAVEVAAHFYGKKRGGVVSRGTSIPVPQ